MKLFTRVLAGVLLAASFTASAQVTLPGVTLENAPMPNPALPMYQSTGEQYRTYDFPGTGESIPYRLFVPENWTPAQSLPILVTLRAGNSVNNNHRENNDLVLEARERGYIVISPLGYRGLRQPYYGSPYPVDREAGPSVPAEGWTEEENARAEMDVLYVLNLVANEYNADVSRIYFHGQNPSGSSVMHFAAKYPDLISAVVNSAGPILTDNYPFENISGKVAVLMLYGDGDVPYGIGASERFVQALKDNGVEAEYHLVTGAVHLNPYLVFVEGVYDFLDAH